MGRPADLRVHSLTYDHDRGVPVMFLTPVDGIGAGLLRRAEMDELDLINVIAAASQQLRRIAQERNR